METNSVKFFKENPYQLPKKILRPIIVAWKLRTPENYGNLIRLADTVGCEKVIFVVRGEELAKRKIKRTAGDSFERVSFEYVGADQLIPSLPKGYQLVAVETAANSSNIYQTKLPENIVLIVGNEKAGIAEDFLTKCQSVVHIPLPGTCTSLNVSHATSVALFEWLRQVMNPK